MKPARRLHDESTLFQRRKALSSRMRRKNPAFPCGLTLTMTTNIAPWAHASPAEERRGWEVAKQVPLTVRRWCRGEVFRNNGKPNAQEDSRKKKDQKTYM